jgi:hypothetical protein
MKKAIPAKVPISMRALIQRINRKLAPHGRQLKKSRGERARSDFGDYYVLDTNRNDILDTDAHVESLGKWLGCMGEWEELTD